MNEEMGLKLLAAVEALHEEVRASRKDAREDREARELLSDRKAADARRQAKYAKRKRENDVINSRENDVSVEVVSSVVDLGSTQKEQLPPDSRKPHVLPSREERPTVATWAAYSAAYHGRYGVKPVRNATTNGQMAQIVKRLGAEDAPKVAAFYVMHNERYYVLKSHPVGLLLKDYEGLRTQWASGRTMTGTESRQIDQTQANVDGWRKHLKGAVNGVD